MFFDTQQVDLSLRKKSGEDLLELAKAQKLYDFRAEASLVHCDTASGSAQAKFGNWSQSLDICGC